MGRRALDPVLARQLGLVEGAIGRAVERREPVQIPDTDAPGAYTGRLRPLLAKAGFRALLAVPLLREDRVLGALLVARRTPGEFPPEVVELLGTYGGNWEVLATAAFVSISVPLIVFFTMQRYLVRGLLAGSVK